MSFLSDITPLVLTFNEAPNIGRALEQLSWAKEILVLDSFSTDETLQIAQSFPHVRILQRAFDTFASQCNFGLEQIRTSWVLSLDADYVLSDGFSQELADLTPRHGTAGYRAAFTYCIYGRPLRASLYPPRTVLYRRAHAKYHDEGHGHRVQVDGPIGGLRSKIYHDDRKPLQRWLAEQNRYGEREAKALLGAAASDLPIQDRLRRWCLPAPLLVFFFTLIGKRLILDGWPGWFYALQRTYAETLLAIHLLDARLARISACPSKVRS